MLEEALEKVEAWRDDAERRRAQLLRAVEEGEVADPITGTIFTLAALKAIAISAAFTIGTSLLTRALTPRQKITTGQIQGTLQVPQSDQGLPITEGYGADPASKAAPFQASHAYALESRVASGGYFYVVTTAGTSGGSAPTFPTAKGATVTSGSVTFTCYGRTGGGFRLGMLIPWTSGLRKHVNKVKSSGGGGKGPKPAEQTEVTYDLDLAVMPGRGPLRVKRVRANTDTIYQNYTSGPTGVPDPTVPPDDDYTQGTIPDPNTPYVRPTTRFSGTLAGDTGGALVGTVAAGSYANISIYPGNTAQLPDPTMQAAVDGQYGADSTPAFWNRCLIMLRNFYLTAYGGAIPIIQTLAEHETLDTLELIYAHWCGRTGVLTPTDYDFSGVRRVFVRGFPVNPPYAPADVMEELARVFNVYFSESDKLYARVRGSVAPVATLASADLGWVDGDAEDEEEELQGLDFDIATETEIARRYEITAVDPDRDFEQNSQGTSRQITSSEKTEKVELALTLYPDEMREFTQRELYEEEIEATRHRLSLDWSYLWLMAGDSLAVVEDDGTTSRIFVESLKPNVGVIPVEGSAEETAVYTQPVSTSGGGVFEVPPVPIPGMTLVGFYDGPLLRDAENSVNNGAGVHAYAVKRRGDGAFTVAALYVDRGLGDELLETFEKEAVFGRTASVLTASTSVHDYVADALTVDLHNEDDSLESYTRDDLSKGAGACIVGSEVCQILTSTREPDTATWPNRWYLTVGLRARRGTDFAINDHAVGEPFVLIDDAIKFIPLNVNELKVTRPYKMASGGQSLADAAVVSQPWEGGSLKHLSPVNVTRADDAADDSLVEWQPRLRMGHGLHNGLSGFDDREREVYDFEVFSDATRAAVVHSARVEGMLAEEVRLDDLSDYDAFGAATNSRAVGRLSLPWDAAFLAARFNDVQSVVSSMGVLDARGAGYTEVGGLGTFYGSPWKVSVGVDPAVGCYVYEGATLLYQQNVAYAEDTADVVIEIAHGRLLVYLNRYDGGDVPVFAASYADLSARDLRPVFADNTTYNRFTNRAQGRVQRFYRLSAAQKVAWYGSAAAPVYANIYRVDPRVGRGYPAEVTLTR